MDEPGYVYGVAVASSRQEEGTPPCACPCHVANTPTGAGGWYCDQCFAMMICGSYPQAEHVPYSHEDAIADGTANPRPYLVGIPDYYFITRGNSLDDAFPRRHFKSEEAAQRAVDRLNQEDVLATLDLDPVSLARREKLKKLGKTFWVSYGDGHPESRWPRKPGRYAVQVFSERYSESFWETYDTLDEAKECISGGEVLCLYDLDEGRPIGFSVSVEVSV